MALNGVGRNGGSMEDKTLGAGGGVNLNNVREANVTRAVTTSDLLFGKHVLLRKGKKNYVVVTAK